MLIAALALCFFAVPAARAEAWTHKAEVGEDATSRFYYLYKSNGSSVVAVRSVWNGGAQNPPEVVDYLIDGGKIVVRRSAGKREDIPALIEGKDAALELKGEYAIQCRDTGAMLLQEDGKPLSDKQRIDVFNLLSLLAQERKPVK